MGGGSKIGYSSSLFRVQLLAKTKAKTLLIFRVIGDFRGNFHDEGVDKEDLGWMTEVYHVHAAREHGGSQANSFAWSLAGRSDVSCTDEKTCLDGKGLPRYASGTDADLFRIRSISSCEPSWKEVGHRPLEKWVRHEKKERQKRYQWRLHMSGFDWQKFSKIFPTYVRLKLNSIVCFCISLQKTSLQWRGSGSQRRRTTED